MYHLHLPPDYFDFRLFGRYFYRAVTFWVPSSDFQSMDYRVSIVLERLECQLIPPFGRYPALTKEYLNVLLIELAVEVNLSPSRLRTLFRDATGQPFVSYARRLRLNKARELLRHTHFRVAEIADRLGYLDTSHFIREFKAAFGMTPTEYRLAIRGGHE
jgi:AraC-like DNA-binding protein